MTRRPGQSIFRTAALVGCSWSAVVSIYQKSSKEETVVSWRQVHGQGSLMHVGSEGWPEWSDPTDELLLLKLLKKLMLVLIEKCQNTQCITICCVWDCIAANQSGCPYWPLSTAESGKNGHVSIRTEPQPNGRRWPGLMNQVFFYITWMAGCVCVLLTRGTHGTQMHYGKKASW